MAEGNRICENDLTFYELGDHKVFSKDEKTLKEYEIEIISHYLKQYQENVILVAEKLDIGKSKIYNLLKSGEIKL